MAEVALGLVGAAATVGGASLATGSGFVGRHESCHRQEILETERNTRIFRENLDRAGEDVTQDEVSQFRKARDEALSNANQYYASIVDYKGTSWLNPVGKMRKKHVVRKWKNLTRQTNHSMRSINESVCSGSDTSSIAASSGSPPGSNLARDDIDDWAHGVYDAPDEVEQWSYYSASGQVQTAESSKSVGHDSASLYSPSAAAPSANAEHSATSPSLPAISAAFLPTASWLPTFPRECSCCRATTTPRWRHDPMTHFPLCSTCWLYVGRRTHQRQRNSKLVDRDIESRQEGQVPDPEYAGPECSHCGVRQTGVWRRSREGLLLCNVCGVYERLRGKKRPLSSSRSLRKMVVPEHADRGAQYSPYPQITLPTLPH